MIIAALVCAIVAFCFKDALFGVILAPQNPDFITYRLLQRIAECFSGAGEGSDMLPLGVRLINTGLAQQFLLHVKTSAYVGLMLAFTGAVKEDVIDVEELSTRLMELLREFYPQVVRERYGVEPDQDVSAYDLLEQAGKKRGYLMSGGVVNTERMAKVLLDEYRAGKLGRLTFEEPEEA